MFRRSTLQSLGFLFLISMLLGQGLLALVAALLLLTAGVAWLWNRWALARVTYARELSQTRAFPGDEVELRIRIANRKPLPLAALGVRDSLPMGLKVIGHDLRVDQNGRQVLQRVTGMRWYEGVIWSYRLECLGRGSYRFGPAQLEAGDPFGFYLSGKEMPQRDSLVVYPRLLPLEELNLPPRNPLGEIKARQLIRDPLRTVGIRDYHPEDPLKDVHWTATARTGRLQTRIYETTTSLELALFLDLDTFEQYWQGIDEEQVERVISAAATLAQVGLDEGHAVGLYVNGAPAQFEQLVRLPPGRSPTQLERIMETLARLTPYSVTSMARVLRITAGDLPSGTTIFLVSTVGAPATCSELLRLRQRGRNVAWLYLGADTPPHVPGVLVRHAPPAQDFRRRKWAPQAETQIQ